MLFNKTRNQGLLDSRNYKAFYKQNIFSNILKKERYNMLQKVQKADQNQVDGPIKSEVICPTRS
jgi:hypothetical protein